MTFEVTDGIGSDRPKESQGGPLKDSSICSKSYEELHGQSLSLDGGDGLIKGFPRFDEQSLGKTKASSRFFWVDLVFPSSSVYPVGDILCPITIFFFFFNLDRPLGLKVRSRDVDAPPTPSTHHKRLFSFYQ